MNNGNDLLARSIQQLQAMVRSKAEYRGLSAELQSAESSVNSLASSSACLSMLLHRCVDFSKASQGAKLQPYLEAVNLRECLNRAVACVRDVKPGALIDFLPMPMEIAATLHTDQQWLSENVLCLLMNAVHAKQHAANQQTSSTVILRTKLEGQSERALRIEVIDRAQAISEELRSMMFTETLCHVRSIGSTGMGMYALAKRCEALGGKYGVEASTGGNVFWIVLPYLADISSDRHISLLSSDEGLAPGMRQRILLVDDNLPNLRMTSKLLEREGYLVEAFADGEDALEIWQSSEMPFDAVLVELDMQDGDGFQTIKRMRMMERKHSISERTQPFVLRAIEEPDDPAASQQLIVAISAHTDPVTLAEVLQVGASAVLQKPFQVQAFNNVMNKHRSSS